MEGRELEIWTDILSLVECLCDEDAIPLKFQCWWIIVPNYFIIRKVYGREVNDAHRLTV